MSDLILDSIQILLWDQLIREQLNHFTKGHLIVIIWINYFEQSINITIGIIGVLNNNIHVDDKLSEFLFVDNTIMVLINLFE